MNTKLKLVLGGAATFLVVGGATFAGLAYADPTPPAPSPSAPSPSAPSPSGTPGAPTQPKQGKHAGGLLGRALHGEATVQGGKKAAGRTQLVVFQRGQVTKISSTAVELKSVDGFTATYALDGQLRVREGKEKGAIGDVKVDQTVRLLAAKDGTQLTAKRIIVVP